MYALWNAFGSLNTNHDETRRVFHGRGHCFPGLENINADFFAPAGLLLVTLYQPQQEGFEAELVTQAQHHSAVKALIVQRRYLERAPSEVLFGVVEDRLAITEAGLEYWIYPGQRQNIGFFLDMAGGRTWVRKHAAQKQVLNLFSYTCAFSVAALAGGADSVVNLDMSKPALARGKENHRLNGQELNRVRFLDHELFRSWGKLKRFGPYELVIIDPPSFQKGSFVATKDYQRVLRRLPELTEPGAEVLVCLNDPAISSEFLQQQMAEQCPQARFIERLQTPEGFPEVDPEKGLKTLIYQIE